MGDAGNDWREARQSAKTARRRGTYECRCGARAWHDDRMCSRCHTPNPARAPVFVLRDESGAYFQGHESGGYIVGKKRDARAFASRTEATLAKPRFGEWTIEEIAR